MKIIYKEDGKIDVEKSIQGELERLKDFDKTLETSYRKPIKEIQAAIKGLEKSDLPLVTDELYALMDKLGEVRRGKIYHKTYELDENGKQIEKSHAFEDLFKYDKYTLDDLKRKGIKSWDQLDPYYRKETNRHAVAQIALDLTGYEEMKWYVSKIEDTEGNVIYTNHIDPNASIIEICEKSIKRFGKLAGIGFLKCKNKDLGFSLYEGEYIIKESKKMLGEVISFIKNGLKCVYPQRKEELIEYLLNNATQPDVGEDGYNIQTTYKIAVQALHKIKDKSSVEEVCKFIDEAREKHSPVNDFAIYYFLAKFGKETGVQIFEDKVIKPAEERGKKVGYSDYYVCSVDKAKATIEKYRQENAQFEKNLPDREYQ